MIRYFIIVNKNCDGVINTSSSLIRGLGVQVPLRYGVVFVRENFNP